MIPSVQFLVFIIQNEHRYKTFFDTRRGLHFLKLYRRDFDVAVARCIMYRKLLLCFITSMFHFLRKKSSNMF